MAITQMYCDKDLQRALADGKTYTENYYRFTGKLAGVGQYDSGHGVDTSTFYSEVDVLGMNERNQILIGDPATLRTRIAYLRDLMGLDMLLMEVAQGGAPHDKICSALELFAKEVIPHFK
jgi:hypothetical protein